jgi:hypothetical protein
MGHSYAQNLVHCVYSTEGRRNSIRPDLQGPLWTFTGSIARQKGIHLISARGNVKSRARTYRLACNSYIGEGSSNHKGLFLTMDGGARR